MSYLSRAKLLEQLEQVNADCRELVLNPDSMRSIIIRGNIIISDNLEKAMWAGTAETNQQLPNDYSNTPYRRI